MFVDREASHNSYLKDAAACWTPGRIDFAATNGHVRRTLEQLRAKINAAILELVLAYCKQYAYGVDDDDDGDADYTPSEPGSLSSAEYDEGSDIDTQVDLEELQQEAHSCAVDAGADPESSLEAAFAEVQAAASKLRACHRARIQQDAQAELDTWQTPSVSEATPTGTCRRR